MIGRTVYHLTILEKIGVVGVMSAIACTQIDEEPVFVYTAMRLSIYDWPSM